MKKIRQTLPLLTLPLAALAAGCTSPTAANDSAHELHDMLDRHQITALVDRLGRALDEGRFDDLRAIYTADATAKTPGGTADGRDALITQASRNHTDDKQIQHFISNVIVDLRGDAADVRANLIAIFGPAANESIPQPQYTLGEIYRFDAVRTREGWRLARVETTPIWSTGTRP
ncbi:nuclear transport factor 2 family protein [Nocardia sp. NBC_00881]|uniref:nuclear transport factor 2 family protein n=1 Tax=Nocardia sp. NBC_00881 TaxID=2975995 RepID=UPI00386A3434|nr:nuclear transport factor 2 family protein [Nocardia sp. NBC_00881]